MTGPETARELTRVHAQRVALVKRMDELSRAESLLIKQCPHEKRMLYTACGVTTDRCVYCGHEVDVRG
jgi:hypothetical protein